jgi:hypothetical protein
VTQRKTLTEQAEHNAEANPTFVLDEGSGLADQPYASNRTARHKARDKRLTKAQSEREADEAQLVAEAEQRVQARKVARAEAKAEEPAK